MDENDEEKEHENEEEWWWMRMIWRKSKQMDQKIRFRLKRKRTENKIGGKKYKCKIRQTVRGPLR